jgi:hypothetical protein
VLSPGAIRNLKESDVQAQIIEWAKWVSFEVGGKRVMLKNLIFANMNGTQIAGNAQQRARYVNAMKKRGMMNGVSDLTIAVPRGKYHGMYLELKREKRGVVSDDQEKFIANMLAMGYYATVAKGYGPAIKSIADYLSEGDFHA